MENQNVMQNRISSFQTGVNSENDIIFTKDLLMKLALAENVFNEMGRYIDAVECNDGVKPDDIDPPDTWAVTGARSNLTQVSHALKCSCFGYETAFLS